MAPYIGSTLAEATWTLRLGAGLICLDIVRPDHLCPFCGVVGDKLAQVCSAAQAGCSAPSSRVTSLTKSQVRSTNGGGDALRLLANCSRDLSVTQSVRGLRSTT